MTAQHLRNIGWFLKLVCPIESSPELSLHNGKLISQTAHLLCSPTIPKPHVLTTPPHYDLA